MSKLENVSERIVSVSVKNNHGFIQLRVVNSYIGEILFKNGEPITGKEDKAAHGFGVRSIRSIAEKYAGRLTLNAQGGLFTLNAVIPVQDKA